MKRSAFLLCLWSFKASLALAQPVPEPVPEPAEPAEPAETEIGEEEGGEQDAELEAELAEKARRAVEQAGDRAVAGRATELAKADYKFCRSDYPADRFERRYCKIVDDGARAVCPGISQLCETHPQTKWAISERLAWAILTCAVVVALLLLLRLLLRRESWRMQAPADLSPSDAGAGPVIQQLPEAPALQILRLSERALDEGRVAEATLMCQVALLRHFDDTGLASFHPSRTNGDYLRAIRRHPRLAALYRKVAHDSDRIRFGDGSADAKRVAEQIPEARALLLAPVTLISEVAGLTGAILLCLAIGSGCDAQPGGNSIYDHSPTGMAAFPELLRAAGLPVVLTTKSLTEVPSKVGVVVLRTSVPHAVLNDLKLDPLLDRNVSVVLIDDGDSGETLLPVSYVRNGTVGTAGRDTIALGVSDRAGCGFDPDLLTPRADDLPRIPMVRQAFAREEAKLRRLSLHPIAMQSLLVDVEAYQSTDNALALSGWREGGDSNEALDGCIFLFTSEALFTNASLARSSNARLVAGFFAALLGDREELWIMEVTDPAGHGRSDLTRSLSQSHLLPFLGQSALLLIALLIAAGAAFGPLFDPVSFRHKTFVEHVEAVGHHYARAGRAGRLHAARALSRLLLIRNRQQLRGAQDASSVALARVLAEKSGIGEARIKDALALGADAESRGSAPVGPLSAGRSDADEVELLQTLSTLVAGRGRPKGRKSRR